METSFECLITLNYIFCCFMIKNTQEKYLHVIAKTNFLFFFILWGDDEIKRHFLIMQKNNTNFTLTRALRMEDNLHTAQFF